MDRINQLIQSRLPPGSFGRNVLTLMTGTTFAQALLIIAAPVLTRLYSPEEFGVYALYTSILSILAVIVCWRYEFAIVLPEEDEDAASLLFISIAICVLMVTIAFIIVGLFRYQIANLLGTKELANWLWLLPMSLLAIGLFQVFNYWSTRRKQFKRLATRQITRSSVTVATQIGFGAAIPAAASCGLIVGDLIGQTVATSRLGAQIIREEGRRIFKSVGFSKSLWAFSRYKAFPLFSSWASLLNTTSAMLPALMLGYFFSPAVVGFYALGHRVLSVPTGMIGGSIAQVFFPRATEARRTGDLASLTIDMFSRLLAIGFVPFLLMTVVAPDLFAMVFGERWWIAGQYMQWMSLWLLFVFISSPLSSIYLVMEKQKENLIVNIFMFISRLAAIITGGLYQNALLSIALFGTTGAILWMFNCIYIQHLAGVTLNRIVAVFAQQFIWGLPYIVLPIGVQLITQNSFAFIVSGIGSGIVFGLIQGYRLKQTGSLI